MKYAELVKQVSKSTTARNMIAINVVKPFDVNMYNAPEFKDISHQVYEDAVNYFTTDGHYPIIYYLAMDEIFCDDQLTAYSIIADSYSIDVYMKYYFGNPLMGIPSGVGSDDMDITSHVPETRDRAEYYFTTLNTPDYGLIDLMYFNHTVGMMRYSGMLFDEDDVTRIIDIVCQSMHIELNKTVFDNYVKFDNIRRALTTLKSSSLDVLLEISIDDMLKECGYERTDKIKSEEITSDDVPF